MADLCHEHSGCVKDIENLKWSDGKQWEELTSIRNRTDKILMRLNVILGGIAVAVIMLALNMFFKIV